MKILFFFISLFFTLIDYSQTNVPYAAIDKKIAAIPQEAKVSTDAIAQYINTNFQTENDKIRAVFYCTATTISYDVPNMFDLHLGESNQDRIDKTLKTKKGVCTDYALIFNAVANAVGIKTVVIEGYTKQYGKIANLSHAWCAAKIDSKWYLFDPTWGSGYVNNKKFTPKLDNSYFKVSPEKSIISHMPFDYLWQFINYPITHQEFIDGRTQINKNKKIFNFDTEIIKYESLPKVDQYFESAQRIEKNGIKNQLISQAYTYAKTSWSNERENSNNNKYNEVVNQYNEAINELNDFIYYRNNKFKPTLADDEIKSKIQIPHDKFLKCQENLSRIVPFNNANSGNINTLKKSVADALIQSENHLEFVNKYLSKSKMTRKTMFSKVTWFGIPLN